MCMYYMHKDIHITGYLRSFLISETLVSNESLFGHQYANDLTEVLRRQLDLYNASLKNIKWPCTYLCVCTSINQFSPSSMWASGMELRETNAASPPKYSHEAL